MKKLIALGLLLVLTLPLNAQPHKIKKHIDRMKVVADHPSASVAFPTDTTETILSIIVEHDSTADLYSAETESPYLAGGVMGDQARIIMLFNFSDNSGNKPYSKSQVQSIWSQVAAFYAAQSYGRSRLTYYVVDWYTSTQRSTDCGSWVVEEVRQHARSVLGDSVMNAIPNHVFVYPTGGCHTLNGVTLTSISSSSTVVSTIYLCGYGGDFRVAAHEYGHSLCNQTMTGLKHSNSATCIGGGAVCDTMTHTEYGNTVECIMGLSNVNGLNGAHKEYLGWLSDVSDITGDWTYTLRSIETSGSQSLLRVQRSWNFNYYGNPVTLSGTMVFEYRANQGVFGTLIGATQQFGNITQEPQYGTQLLTLNPSAGRRWLSTGETFYDPALSMYVKVLSMSSSSADVRVQFGSPVAPTRFELPLVIRANHVASSESLWLGIMPSASMCITDQDSFSYQHRELFAPAPPPTGVFDARFISPRSSPGGCYDLGSKV